MKLSFENIEETEVVDLTTGQDILTQEEDAGIAASLQYQMDEAIDTQDTLNKMQDVAPEEAVKLATEHMLRRVGYNRKSVSMESFDLKQTDFNEAIDKSLSVAQEGILSRFGRTLQFAFTTENRMNKQVFDVIERIKSRGAKTDTIMEPGWGRIFTTTGKRVLDGQDVLAIVAKYQKIISSSDFTRLCDGVGEILSKVTIELQKSRFIADDAATAEIVRLNKEGEELIKDIEKLLANEAVRQLDSSFKPLTIAEAEKLMKTITIVLNDGTLDSTMKKLDTAITKYNNTVFINGQTRLVGVMAKDIRAAIGLVNSLNPATYCIYDLVRNRSKVCFSSIQYVKASTN